MTAFVFVVLLLSLVRDQRAYLANEVVRRRQEAMDQAGLLGTVFESINEALVLMDTLGVVQLHNAAAVQILGRDKLTTEPSRWLRRMAESPSFTYGYNRDGSEDGLRILAVQLARVHVRRLRRRRRDRAGRHHRAARASRSSPASPPWRPTT